MWIYHEWRCLIASVPALEGLRGSHAEEFPFFGVLEMTVIRGHTLPDDNVHTEVPVDGERFTTLNLVRPRQTLVPAPCRV